MYLKNFQNFQYFFEKCSHILGFGWFWSSFPVDLSSKTIPNQGYEVNNKTFFWKLFFHHNLQVIFCESGPSSERDFAEHIPRPGGSYTDSFLEPESWTSSRPAAFSFPRKAQITSPERTGQSPCWKSTQKKFFGICTLSYDCGTEFFNFSGELG